MADEKKRIRVKMLTSIAGRTEASATGHATGDIVDLDADVAKVWVKEGMAQLVRADTSLETAVTR